MSGVKNLQRTINFFEIAVKDSSKITIWSATCINIYSILAYITYKYIYYIFRNNNSDN